MSADAGTSRRWVAVVLTAAILLVLGSEPRSGSGVAPFPHADKVAHAIAYSVLGLLAARAARGSSGGALAPIVVALVTALLVGTIDELHQRVVPGRTCDLWDAAADAVGGLLGGVGFVLVAGYLRTRRISSQNAGSSLPSDQIAIPRRP